MKTRSAAPGARRTLSAAPGLPLAGALGLAACLALLPAAPLPAQTPDTFAWTVGDWAGVRRDGATGQEDPMSLTVEPILGGTAYLRRVEVQGERGPYLGISIQVWDPEHLMWRWSYTSANRGWFAEYDAVDIDGKRSIWRPSEPRIRTARMTSELLDTGVWRRTMEYSNDGGDTWGVRWLDELRPAEPAADPLEGGPGVGHGPRPHGPDLWVYDCPAPDGTSFAFTARVDPDALAVWLPARFQGRQLTLPQTAAASGVRYEADGVVVWTKGNEAMLEVDGVRYEGCRARPAAS